jgi:nitroreductase
MELTEALRRRRMVRRYTGEPVDPGSLDRIVAAGLSGPSAGWAQGISAVVVADPARIAEVAAACGEERYIARGFDPWLSTAGAHIALCVEPEVYRTRYSEPDKVPAVLDAIPWWLVDGGAALMAILLAVVDEGLAAGFHGAHGAGPVADLLGIPGDVELLGIVTIGHPAADRRSASLDRGRRPGTVHRETW